MYGYTGMYESPEARVSLGFFRDVNRQRFSVLVEGVVHSYTSPGMTGARFEFDQETHAMEFAKMLAAKDGTLRPIGVMCEEARQPPAV